MSALPQFATSPCTWREEVVLRAGHATRDDAPAALAWSLAELEDLLAATARVDPDTGAPTGRLLSQVLTDLRAGLAAESPTIPRDALVRTALHAAEPLEEVVAAPRTRLQRHHTLERPDRARTLDARSMAWLARQPGRDARSKLGASRKLLAVVREASAEVPANRFVRRLAAELGARLDTVFAHVPADVTLDDNARVLRGLQALCRLDRPDSPLAGVRPAVAPVPDNVLLGDRRYARLWRAWEALRTLDDAVNARWRSGETWLAAAVAWSVIARLSALEGAQVEERWVTFAPRAPGPGAEGARVYLRIPGGVLQVTVRTDAEEVAVEAVGWTGVTRLQRQAARTWSYACAFDTTASVVPGQGHPAVLVEGTERHTFSASRRGLPTIADRVILALELPFLPVRPEPAPAQAAPCHLVGIDLAGPRLRVSRDGAAHQGSLLFARDTACDGHQTWVVGDAAARWATREAGEAWSAADLWRRAIAQGINATEGPALAAIADLAQREMGAPGPRAQVAVAVPDGLDELSLATLRSALSGAFSHTPRWVWRSVAAAVAWREEGPCPVAPGASVVVLDLAMPRFGGAVLIAREEGDADGWYWERPLPMLAVHWDAQHDADAAIAASLQATDPGLSAEVASRAAAFDVGPAEAHDVRLVPTEAQLFLGGVDAADAVQRIAQRAVAWARDFERREGLARARKAGTGDTVHVLVVGAPLGDETARVVADALRDAVAWCRSSVHVPNAPGSAVARGASATLRRLAQRRPVWVDILPQLSLEVTLKGSRRTLEIFPRKAVRAGEDVPHRVPERMRIPAGVRGLKLPLRRDDDGRTGVDLDARIDDPSFPLKHDVEVRIDVRFRRVDERFHVTLRPEGPAPFSALEVAWERHGAEDTRREIVDAPPAWPEAVAFAALAEEVSGGFARAALGLQARAPEMEAKRLKPRIHAARNDPKKRDALVAELEDLSKALRAVDDAAQQLLAPGRRVADAPPTLRSRLEVVAPLLDGLITKPPCDGESSTELRKAGGTVVTAAARAMSRLRGAATEGFVAKVLDDARGPLAAPRWHLLGRCLADGRSPVRTRAIARLADEFQGPDGPRDEHLWALATALWSDEDFVFAAAPHRDAWMQGITKTLDVIEAGSSRREALDECAAVLLGLLRLRGTPHGAPLSANELSVRALGDRLARIDRNLETRRRPRLRVTGDRALADVTASALRGEAVARIEMMEEGQ
jgi:hypothetical protein